ncbi:MAG TPA: SIS domain-containing protein [Nitrososphaera sp.]|nr:SIS domain-containing protein [Nitrososphaera sp.]
MNPIEAMRAEIEYQAQDLEKQSLPHPRKNCLFVGSGDSFVAGLVAHYISGGHALCCYPTDIIHNPSVVDGRDVYIVSISGNTKANILAARTARRRRGGVLTTAITAKPASRLAKECHKVIALKYRSAGITTAGTISFSSSMLTCASLATKISLPRDLGSLYKRAKFQAETIASEIGNGTCFILGDSICYPVAVYGALKFNEVFGRKAFAYPAEEFCHSPLFSLKKGDTLIVMENKQLDQRLRDDGYSSVHVDFRGERGIRLLMRSTFFMQCLVLKLAQRHGLTTCYFLKNKRLLKTSSDFIYA